MYESTLTKNHPPRSKPQPGAPPQPPNTGRNGGANGRFENPSASQPVGPQQVTDRPPGEENDLLRHRPPSPGDAPLEEQSPAPADSAASASTSDEPGCGIFSAMLEEAVEAEQEQARRQAAAEQQRLEAVRGETSRRNVPLTRSEEDQVLLLIIQGHSIREAATWVGIHHSTITKRTKRDPNFAAAIDRARQKARKDPLHAIREASRHSWRAAAWLVNYLDRRDRRGRPTKEKKTTPGERADPIGERGA